MKYSGNDLKIITGKLVSNRRAEVAGCKTWFMWQDCHNWMKCVPFRARNSGGGNLQNQMKSIASVSEGIIHVKYILKVYIKIYIYTHIYA